MSAWTPPLPASTSSCLSTDARRLASALDAAFALDPRDRGLARERALLLDGLSIEELGIVWRYVPAGTFLMGSESGDPDERPVHPQAPGEMWVSETPITWAAYCDLLGWSPPPLGMPLTDSPLEGDAAFSLRESNKIRLQYCETETVGARDWHSHAPHVRYQDRDGNDLGSPFERSPPRRANPSRPVQYDRKPMVAISWDAARDFAARISTERVVYRLPTEAEWEKAARGGLAGCRWSWGDALPDPSRCDFGHFGEFFVRDPLTLPPNGYGLFGMCGGVWEWTEDVYDALAYRKGTPPADGAERVLRGGSWADCASACTVSFRMSMGATGRDGDTPNVGFRLVRVERSAGAASPK